MAGGGDPLTETRLHEQILSASRKPGGRSRSFIRRAMRRGRRGARAARARRSSRGGRTSSGTCEARDCGGRRSDRRARWASLARRKMEPEQDAGRGLVSRGGLEGVEQSCRCVRAVMAWKSVGSAGSARGAPARSATTPGGGGRRRAGSRRPLETSRALPATAAASTMSGCSRSAMRRAVCSCRTLPGHW